MRDSALDNFKEEFRKENTSNGLVPEKTYFYIDVDGYVMNDQGRYLTRTQIEFGNCFTSRKNAEEVAQKEQEVLKKKEGGL